ncbi:hypothetical protein [Algiphilus aromaticivorans]|uniref:hypothetical protein n=1 Tax=Algiphilus aromaticivorans TaxID=382454 RepID=UPI0005C233D5|nr:hypothetical protein [Algiphilus aromaticivorans]
MQDNSDQEDLRALEDELGKELDEGGDFSAALSRDDDSHSDTGAASQAAAPSAEADKSKDTEDGGQSQSDQAKAGDGEGTDQQQPDGVLTRDGKNVIPYHVLEQTRRRATEAERENSQLREQAQEAKRKDQELEQMRQKLTEHAEAQGDQVQQQGDPLEGLNEDDYPAELVNAIKAANARANEAHQAMQEMRKQTQQREASERQKTQSEIQTHIDANPDLSAWQAENGDAWAAAVAHDQRLRESPRWADKPLEERFKKAVELTKAELDLHDPAPAGSGDTKSDDGQQAKTDQGAAVSSKQDDVPAGISDIPGGATPSQSQQEGEDDMSPQALAAKVDRYSNEDIDEWLRRHG